MRINSGKFRGKKLIFKELKTTRPSKSILKLALFNILSSRIKNSIFLEAFAGYGSIGIEAISMGARQAFFIEKNIDAFNLLKQNAALFNEAKLYFGNAFNVLNSAEFPVEIFDFLYFDPPFNMNINPIFNINFINRLNKNAICIIEHHSKQIINIKGLKLIDVRKYGNSSLSFLHL